MHTYSRFISEGSSSTCSLGSQLSDLLRVYMYTQVCLSFVLDPVRFSLFFSFLFPLSFSVMSSPNFAGL